MGGESFLGGLFGGGDYEAPAAPKTEPVPLRETVDPEEKDVRDIERRRRRARQGGVNATLLTTKLGDRAPGLLGAPFSQ